MHYEKYAMLFFHHFLSILALHAFDIDTLRRWLAVKFSALQVKVLVRAIAIDDMHDAVFIGDVGVSLKSIRGEFQEGIVIVVTLHLLPE